MKNQDRKRAENLLALLCKGNYFDKQNKECEEDDSCTMPFKAFSQNELNLVVIDLLNAGNLLLHHNAKGLLDVKKDNYVSVIALLKIALKSLQEDEMKL